ncbi:MAG: hypothetical protein K0S03_720 [Burkholderiales bacterium]|jgi:hypothetical protein|nr:hypothetical protein [Burkholderiales bacterium]
MSAPEKAAPHPARDTYHQLAFEIFIGMASRIYSAPAVAGESKPDPKALALLSFRLAEAYFAAEKETPRAKAAAEILSKARVNLDDVDLSGVFQSTAKP